MRTQAQSKKQDGLYRQEMGMIPQLYEIDCKLFENDVEKLKSEWESVVA